MNIKELLEEFIEDLKRLLSGETDVKDIKELADKFFNDIETSKAEMVVQTIRLLDLPVVDLMSKSEDDFYNNLKRVTQIANELEQSGNAIALVPMVSIVADLHLFGALDIQ